jgi:hypothetical protein
MHLEWLAVEHHRLHVVEEWPESAHKRAALAAIESTLASLTRRFPGSDLPACQVCRSRALGGSEELAA